ncbi:MAG: hypothetical protein KC414_13620 [Romboutsia sp.]|nr:hypothetical protein [Romboutsia sp.]
MPSFFLDKMKPLELIETLEKLEEATHKIRIKLRQIESFYKEIIHNMTAYYVTDLSAIGQNGDYVYLLFRIRNALRYTLVTVPLNIWFPENEVDRQVFDAYLESVGFLNIKNEISNDELTKVMEDNNMVWI